MRRWAAAGLTRPARRRAFCPACPGWGEDARREIAPQAVVAAIMLALAAAAWTALVIQSRSMAGTAMGLGPLPAFAAAWTLMTTAMMVPSAVPFACEFARLNERRRGWRPATVLLAATYLSIWLGFGLLCFAAYAALRMPWPDQTLVGGVALAAAGAYALSPLKRGCEARCRQLSALQGPLPFSLPRTALLAGARYGLSCAGCTAPVMVATLLVGMPNLAWMAALTAVVVAYKLAPEPGPRVRASLAAVLVVLGVVYTVAAAA